MPKGTVGRPDEQERSCVRKSPGSFVQLVVTAPAIALPKSGPQTLNCKVMTPCCTSNVIYTPRHSFAPRILHYGDGHVTDRATLSLIHCRGVSLFQDGASGPNGRPAALAARPEFNRGRAAVKRQTVQDLTSSSVTAICSGM